MPPRRSARQAAAAASAAISASANAPAPAPATPVRGRRNTKRSATHSNANPRTPPTKKIKHSGLQGSVTRRDTKAPLGVVDPESDLSGNITTLDHDPCDVMLVLVDPSRNMDKFFILQLIEASSGDQYHVYTRWGRTGTVGQALQQDFDEESEAQDCFEKKFKQKTGLEWYDREEPSKNNKYRYIQQDYESKQAGFQGAQWQYWVDDGVDGKEDGWYDYDQEGSMQAERLFAEHVKNQDLTNRWVKSGAWTYDMDLVNMTQTNAEHEAHKQRRIRRVPEGAEPDDSPPLASKPAKKAAPKKKAPPATPAKSAKKAAAVVTPVRSSAAVASSSSKSGPPVDPDVSLWGQSSTAFEVVPFADNPDRFYDAVLNQCNINNNNNKYYRIQMILNSATGQYYVWQKWGRVGEPGRRTASALKGPFGSETAALPEYSKKFRAKTGNNYDTEDFESVSGKYTLIEIDNNVTAEQASGGAASAAAPAVEYEDSKLDAKTKELVEVLFSKDMRDEALTSFNLDLKRLPLGVPSETQIQHGIDILQQIEDKLAGNTVQGSYEELSSQFYTAIPHSFGRTRPPTIRSADSLQSRYDMCNILLDMYSTNETVIRLQKDESNSKAGTKVPNPVDQHYASLNTDLTPVDPESDEHKLVVDYFEKTKGQHSRSQLLDVWEVNRHSEGKRFQKFAKLDNRRLLWHGTNIAVVAPILTSGLRIMPHSGGRVGAGIYLASLQQKSDSYTSGYGAKYACMFLCEGALGKMHTVNEDGHHASSLKKAPKGFDSVHAVGKHAPEEWGEMTIEGNTVAVPTSAPKDQADVESSFYHDEFLCYDEAQVRIRYVVTVRK